VGIDEAGDRNAAARLDDLRASMRDRRRNLGDGVASIRMSPCRSPWRSIVTIVAPRISVASAVAVMRRLLLQVARSE